MPRQKPFEPSFRHLLPLLLILGLSGCASNPTLRNIQFTTLTAVSSYHSALHYYKSGDIMLARRAAMRTDRSRPDYPQAQALLKNKIEPARRRLLRHYRLAGIRAERRGKLYIAKEQYLKAADLSVADHRMQKAAERVDLVMRQKRLDRLSQERRREDEALLDALDRYTPPSGLDPNDTPFIRELDRLQDLIQTRGRNAWNAAKRELHEGHPEVAYVEAESYQRLRPGSKRGAMLMREVRKALPKGLRLPHEAKGRAAGKATGRPETVASAVSAEQIRKLMAEDKWIQARDYARVYRRAGGDEADQLLQTIERTLKKQADAAFRTGQLAFRNEQLDKAVEAWSQAVRMQPGNRDYIDSLRRAKELQESFRILQGKGNNADN